MKGDYVLATKFNDGDPKDHFCVGFYDSSYDHYGQTRHLITDNDGNQFRNNGFRRVARISRRRGEWIVYHLRLIESSHFSVWHWWRAAWAELDSVTTLFATETAQLCRT